MDDITNKQNQKRRRYVSALLVINEISQASLAEKIGVTQQYLSYVVLGQRGGTRKPGPKADIIRKAVSDALGIPINELWPTVIKRTKPHVRNAYNP